MKRRNYLKLLLTSTLGTLTYKNSIAQMMGMGRGNGMMGMGRRNGMGSGMMNESSAVDKIPLQPYTLPKIDYGKKEKGVQVFRLNLQKGVSGILPGRLTKTWGINQAFLGPVLALQKGMNVRMEVENSLPDTVAMHWHGFILPALADGGPHQPIAPNRKWHASWKVINEAATYFYHAHTHGKTGSQVYRGLAGQIQVIDKERDDKLGIPHEYGVNDFPVILTDRSFTADGQLSYSTAMFNRMHGMHGEVVLVNGAANPLLKPAQIYIRLRLHNASNARFYDMSFSDQRSFQIIASDGGLLPAPVSSKRILLAPAERYDILVNLADKKVVTLLARAGSGNLGRSSNRSIAILKIDPSLVRKVASAKLKPFPSLPFTSNQRIAKEREFTFDMTMGMRAMMGGDNFTINRRGFDMQRVDAKLVANTYEIWRLTNPSVMQHPIHIHNTQFRVLSRNGKPPTAIESGLKDTVLLKQNDDVRILIPTGPYRNSKLPYMYHCHILEHEDAGMMGQFMVV